MLSSPTAGGYCLSTDYLQCSSSSMPTEVPRHAVRVRSAAVIQHIAHSEVESK